jgi:hypothetical protein
VRPALAQSREGFWLMRTKIDKKIASRETTNVRKVNGNGSMGGHAGTSPMFQAIHPAKPATWSSTNHAGAGHPRQGV